MTGVVTDVVQVLCRPVAEWRRHSAGLKPDVGCRRTVVGVSWWSASAGGRLRSVVGFGRRSASAGHRIRLMVGVCRWSASVVGQLRPVVGFG
ncbi:hypothetical protein [Streptomyces sp. WAC 06783]|uniref:hypothetical protein n=1 Tax=Streptomyces sp. WAC 06783 TaxID=2203211 RepID=UPI0011CFAA07|nr:hypothetical protein [Streptomyces sp. WAC 06783]